MADVVVHGPVSWNLVVDLDELPANGEAMHTTDYQDLDQTPEQTASTTATLAANAAHLARLLRQSAYPPA